MCGTIQRHFFFFLFESLSENSKAEPKKRLVNYFTAPQESAGFVQFTGFDSPHMAVAHKPNTQSVVVGLSGVVGVLGSGVASTEESIPMGKELAAITSIHGVTTIDGYVYGVGPRRSVCRRIAANKWESIADHKGSMPVPKRSETGMTDDGFNAIDAFAPNDIYCVGGYGDVWRFDGSRWWNCPVPTNLLLESVCCAGDGYVYIGASSGSVLKGRNDNWKMIHKGQMTLPFKDMVWFANKVWCTSDYGVWVIEDEKVIEADLPAEIRACSGNLSVADGVMLLAGVWGAAVFDGKRWDVIISKFEEK